VRTSWGQRGIRRVAEALLERGTLTGEDVRAICDDQRDTRARGGLGGKSRTRAAMDHERHTSYGCLAMLATL